MCRDIVSILGVEAIDALLELLEICKEDHVDDRGTADRHSKSAKRGGAEEVDARHLDFGTRLCKQRLLIKSLGHINRVRLLMSVSSQIAAQPILTHVQLTMPQRPPPAMTAQGLVGD